MTDNSQEKKQDPADFLHAMAEGNEQPPPGDDNHAPISLDGSPVEPDNDDSTGEEIGEQERAFMSPDEGEDTPPSLGEVNAPPQDQEARKAREAHVQRASKRVHAKQFKQTMVPLLIAAAMLLLIMASWVYVEMPSAESAAANPNGSLMSRPWAKFAVLAAYPLSAFLLLGAFLFYRDLQHEKG